MSIHLFGLIATPFGTAANNRGETEGNLTTLQKILWNGDVHTTVSAEAIRFAIRYYWQLQNVDAVNRRWETGEKLEHTWKDPNFEQWTESIDDDVLGFMKAEGAKEDASDSGESGSGKSTSKQKARGTIERRRARLEVTRAISLTPFIGDVTFNAAQIGATPSASSTGADPVPYGTEVHATRYQYGFALTPEHLHSKARAIDVVDAVVNLHDVAGNQARFLFDFSPDAIIFRLTSDPAPRILYGFAPAGGNGSSDARILGVPDIIRRVEWGDVDPKELIIGGSIVETDDGKKLIEWAAQGRKTSSSSPEGNGHSGVKAAAAKVKALLRSKLQIT